MYIIIVGAGKAGTLHLQSYIRIFGDSLPLIAVVDIKGPAPQFTDLLCRHKLKPLRVSRLGEIQRNVAHIGPVLVDICSPTDTHVAVIRDAVAAGFDNILVEKPITSVYNDFEFIRTLDINLAVVSNYFYSKLTQVIGEVLTRKPTAPRLVAMNFSKNRIPDTSQCRGFVDTRPPHVFTVEVPHQLYLLSTWVGRPHLISAAVEDMVIGERHFQDHGAGLILCKNYPKRWPGEETTSLLWSDLTSHRKIRRVLMIWKDGTVLQADYPLDNKLVSKLATRENGHLQFRLFPNDDMLTRNLASLYYRFLHNQIGKFFPSIQMIDQQVRCLDELIKLTSHRKNA